MTVEELIERIESNLDCWFQEERDLLKDAVDLKMYGRGDLHALVARYSTSAAEGGVASCSNEVTNRNFKLWKERKDL